MAILVYTEIEKEILRKVLFEVASYAKAIANAMNTTVTAIAFNATNAEELGNYGVSKVLNVNHTDLEVFNAKAYANIISEAASSEEASVLVISSSADSRYLGGILAAQLAAGYVPNVVEAPISVSPFVVKRTAFSNKGFAHTQVDASIKMVGVSNNAFGIVEDKVATTVEALNPSLEPNALLPNQ